MWYYLSKRAVSDNRFIGVTKNLSESPFFGGSMEGFRGTSSHQEMIRTSEVKIADIPVMAQSRTDSGELRFLGGNHQLTGFWNLS